MDEDRSPLPDDAFTGRVIGLLYDVYRTVGSGRPEARYRTAFRSALVEAGIPVARGKVQSLTYGERVVGRYRVDFVLNGELAVEFARGNSIPAEDFSRTLCYLRDSGLQLALLAVFGDHELRIKRVILTRETEE
ncbi:MAG: GxxExxY protein [Patescibacteria group bacterium]